MFTKHQEGLNGADWEWHIIGRRRVLKMRVQAKRLQCDNILKIRHAVASSGAQQRTLLIAGALASGMKPIYCFYSAENQRSIWTQPAWRGGWTGYQAGCLLADASQIPLTATRLFQVEHNCIPWHFLFHRLAYAHTADEHLAFDDHHQLYFMLAERSVRLVAKATVDMDDAPVDRWTPPTVRDLNEDSTAPFDPVGVHATTDEDRARLESDTADAGEIRQHDMERLRETRVARMLVIDVRDQ